MDRKIIKLFFSDSSSSQNDDELAIVEPQRDTIELDSDVEDDIPRIKIEKQDQLSMENIMPPIPPHFEGSDNDDMDYNLPVNILAGMLEVEMTEGDPSELRATKQKMPRTKTTKRKLRPISPATIAEKSKLKALQSLKDTDNKLKMDCIIRLERCSVPTNDKQPSDDNKPSETNDPKETTESQSTEEAVEADVITPAEAETTNGDKSSKENVDAANEPLKDSDKLSVIELDDEEDKVAAVEAPKDTEKSSSSPKPSSDDAVIIELDDDDEADKVKDDSKKNQPTEEVIDIDDDDEEIVEKVSEPITEVSSIEIAEQEKDVEQATQDNETNNEVKEPVEKSGDVLEISDEEDVNVKISKESSDKTSVDGETNPTIPINEETSLEDDIQKTVETTETTEESTVNSSAEGEEIRKIDLSTDKEFNDEEEDSLSQSSKKTASATTSNGKVYVDGKELDEDDFESSSSSSDDEEEQPSGKQQKNISIEDEIEEINSVEDSSKTAHSNGFGSEKSSCNFDLIESMIKENLTVPVPDKSKIDESSSSPHSKEV